MMTTTIRSMSVLAVAVAVASCAGPAAVPVGPGPSPAARQAPPPPMQPRPVEFPGFHEATLPNGLRLIVVERRELPLASVNLYVRSGAAADPADAAGLAGMVAELLTRGTPDRSAVQISETIEGAGGMLMAGATQDFVSITSSILSERLPLAFELIADVAQRPTFPDAELELARTRTLSGLQLELSDPGSVAQRRFSTEVYGRDHPYALAPVPATVRGISRDAVQQFHATHFRADNALLVVSGDASAAQVEALARQHFGNWQGGGAPQVSFTDPPARGPTTISLLHRPGSVQSNILIGHVAIRPDNPDFYPLQVLNKILGGGADSRLFMTLREEKGWTYGAYSDITRPRDVGYFVANAEVRTEVTDSAVTELLAQLRRLREARVTADELTSAKSFLTGSFPLRIQTGAQVAAQVARMRLLGLPVESLLEYQDRIAAVSAADVQRVAQQYIHPDRAAVVIVGDAGQVLPMVEHIAPVNLFDVEGRALQRADLEVRTPDGGFDIAALQPYALRYRLVVQGNPMGTVTSTLARDGDIWVARSQIESPVITQDSELRFTAAGEPISMRETSTQGGMQMATQLRLENGRIVGEATMPPQAGGDRAFDGAVPPGTLLPGMESIFATVAALEPGGSITYPVFQAATATAGVVTFRVVGEEEVTVPAGTFAAYRVELTGGAAPVTVLMRRDAPHILLRQEPVGVPVVIELEQIGG